MQTKTREGEVGFGRVEGRDDAEAVAWESEGAGGRRSVSRRGRERSAAYLQANQLPCPVILQWRGGVRN